MITNEDKNNLLAEIELFGQQGGLPLYEEHLIERLPNNDSVPITNNNVVSAIHRRTILTVGDKVEVIIANRKFTYTVKKVSHLSIEFTKEAIWL